MKKPYDIIVGLHSIGEALKNPMRQNPWLLVTEKGWKDLKAAKIDPKILAAVEKKVVPMDQFQQEAHKLYTQLDLKFSRVPSQALLKVSPLEIHDTSWLIQLLQKKEPQKIFCLDQVTDVHNGAAILRTAAFYGVNALVLPFKGSLGFGPSFFRIASGAAEHVHIVQCNNLSKLLRTLMSKGVECIGFAEEGTPEEIPRTFSSQSRCLVMGAEDKGLSHAVARVLEKKVAFESLGKIKTLNVSVAAALGMERYFLSSLKFS